MCRSEWHNSHNLIALFPVKYVQPVDQHVTEAELFLLRQVFDSHVRLI